MKLLASSSSSSSSSLSIPSIDDAASAALLALSALEAVAEEMDARARAKREKIELSVSLLMLLLASPVISGVRLGLDDAEAVVEDGKTRLIPLGPAAGGVETLLEELISVRHTGQVRAVCSHC